MVKGLKVHGVYDRDGEAKVWNGLQLCMTGMGNRQVRRLGTGRVEMVTCEKCLAYIAAKLEVR